MNKANLGTPDKIAYAQTIERLWTLEFVAINLICLLAFGTLSIFYGFYGFLETRGVAPAWRGLLIGLFSFAALLLRPFISTRLQPRVTIAALALGQFVSIVALSSYSLVENTFSLALLRLLHGGGYVLTLSSAMAILAMIMPASRSGEGFGINSLMALLPNAVVPYVAETWLSQSPSGSIYNWGALLMLPGLAVLPLLRGATSGRSEYECPTLEAPTKDGTWTRIRKGLSEPGASALLGAFGLVFLSIVLIFFFLKPICLIRQMGEPGLFFTISSGVVIVARAVFARFFDRMDRKSLCAAGLIAMGGSLALLALVHLRSAFFLSAMIFGLGMGVATPMLNSLMFLITRPNLRGLNTNLMLQMLDAAWVVGPVLGGAIIAISMRNNAGDGSELLFTASSAAFAAAVLVVLWVPRISISGKTEADV